eukprot:745935-Hanusia_phi.AAC.2
MMGGVGERRRKDLVREVRLRRKSRQVSLLEVGWLPVSSLASSRSRLTLVRESRQVSLHEILLVRKRAQLSLHQVRLPDP